MNKVKYIIDFDMDHVLADFEKSYKENYKSVQQFPQAGAMFFHDLNPLASKGSGDYLVDNITYVHSLIDLGHTVRIVTAPSLPNVNCWSGKAYWIEKYFGQKLLSNLIITYDKSPLSMTGDILVDDGINNGQQAYGTRHLLYGGVKYPTMKDVYDKILEWSDEGVIFSLEEKVETYKQYYERIKKH